MKSLARPAVFSLLLAAASGQSVAPAGSLPVKSMPGVVVMSPFEVNADDDLGYVASATLAGTRTNEKLAELPNSISVMTAEFLSDLALNDVFDAVEFGLGAENVYNETGVAGAPVGSRSGNQVNFRGIPSLRQLRDGFPWFLPQDSYNTELIEFARGPAGLAYGDADPAGLINVATKRASFRRRASATVRYDNFGTQRYSIDLNQPLAPWLSVRVNALNSEVEQSRQRAHRNWRGYAGALRWLPFKDGRTRFDATYETGHLRRSLSTLQLNDATKAYLPGSGTNAPDANPSAAGVQINGIGMRRIAAPGNTRTFLDIGGVLYDMQSTATTTFRNSIVPTGSSVATGTDPQNPARHPLTPIPFSVVPEGEDWGGPDNRHDSDFHTYTLELSHSFGRHVRVLLAHNAQVDATVRPQTYSSANALGTDTRAVFIDVNRMLPHPTLRGATIPNPRFEELFVAYAPTLHADGNRATGWRTSAVYDTPLPFWNSAIRTVLGASDRHEQSYLDTYAFALAREEIARRGLTGTAATYPNNLVHPVHYLADGNSDDALRLHVEPGVTTFYRSGSSQLRFDQTLGSGMFTTLGSFFGGRL
ncbi:MAG: TonB-dependent receptor plug domain-containing protein, partial [Opitutaceae bacterium]